MAVLSDSTRRRHSRLEHLFRAARILLASALLHAVTLSAQTAPSKEYQIKAIFLFNFAQFVEWPTNAFPEVETPLVIGVLGNDPFGSYLDDAVRGEKINNRPLTVHRYRSVADVGICHVLFVNRSEPKRAEIFSGLAARNILTVGEGDDFTRQGGMIRFVTEKNKLRLKINVEAARAANLIISSKLLRLAEVVTPEKD